MLASTRRNSKLRPRNLNLAKAYPPNEEVKSTISEAEPDTITLLRKYRKKAMRLNTTRYPSMVGFLAKILRGSPHNSVEFLKDERIIQITGQQMIIAVGIMTSRMPTWPNLHFLCCRFTLICFTFQTIERSNTQLH
jgi:hypothetical protein